MNISQEYIAIIQERYEERFLQFKDGNLLKKKLDEAILHSSMDAKICFKYLYAFMPDEDVVSYDENLFLKFVDFALMVKDKVSWGHEMDDTVFLNYVLQYRINNENIEFYKKEFFEELYPLIQDKGMYEAALLVNYWCFEKAVYETTDSRTISPLTALKRTIARCGEESTLAVAALRSVGIPARQVYTPRWAHCDDNHAWVEAWIDGEWHFLGACEPETKLDTGWFMLAASKAMLIHNKVFSNVVEGELITVQNKYATEINRLPAYADTQEVFAKVVDTYGQPVKDAVVRFEVVNFAQLFPLVTLNTDDLGMVHFTTGYGSLMVEASKDGMLAHKLMDVREVSSLELTLLSEPSDFYDMEEFTLVPPVGKAPVEEEDSQISKDKHKIYMDAALEKRQNYRASFYTGDKAYSYSNSYPLYKETIKSCLENSLGNYKEIIEFLESDVEDVDFNYKVELLKTLLPKDLGDITCEQLIEHLSFALKYKDLFEQEIFINYILNPRVHLEMIVSYRKNIFSYFDENTRSKFRENPHLIYDFIQNEIEIGTENQFSTLCASSYGLLLHKRGNAISRKVLFVAICRSLGIPAKLQKSDNSLAYYLSGTWYYPGKTINETRKTGLLSLKKDKDCCKDKFQYEENFTVAILKEGFYQTLDLSDQPFDQEQICYKLDQGQYRITTANRKADGTILARCYYTSLLDTASLIIGLTKEEMKTEKVVIPPLTLQKHGKQYGLSQMIQGEKAVIAFIEPDAEPSQHLLNELLENKDDFIKSNIKIFLILNNETDKNNMLLQKVLKEISYGQIFVGFEPDYLNNIYDLFHIVDKKLPLVYLLDETMTAEYAWSGYNVGIGKLLIKYADKI